MLFVGFQGYSKAIPGPSVLLSFSERILNTAQEFVFPSSEKGIAKPAKVKPIMKTKAPDPFRFLSPIQEKPAQQAGIEIRLDGMWIVAE